MDAIKFTLDVLFWGITLLSAGTIGEITYDLAHKAAQGQMHFVELGKWNRSLTGGGNPVTKGTKREYKNIEIEKERRLFLKKFENH